MSEAHPRGGPGETRGARADIPASTQGRTTHDILREPPEIGDDRPPDDLAWLKRRDDPRVMRFLEEENRHTERAMAPMVAFQERLYREFRARLEETDRSAPVRVDEWQYYHRTEEEKPYRIWARMRAVPGAEEQVVLDENALAARHGFFRLGPHEVSPDHRTLAYAFDTSGNEEYTLVFKDLETGALHPEAIPRVATTLAWAEDARTVFYVARDDKKRAHRVYRHRLGDDPSRDDLVFEEADAAFHVKIRKTRTRRFIVIRGASAVTSETRLIDAHRPSEPPRLLLPRRAGIEYDVTDAGDALLVRTNEEALNFRLLRAPLGGDGSWAPRDAWTEVLPARPHVMLERVEAFRDFLALVEREGGIQHLYIQPRDGGAGYRLPMPEPVGHVSVDRNPEYGASRFRYTFASPVTPETTYDLDPASGRSERVKRRVVHGFDRDRYAVERLEAWAEDGVAVPISVLRRNDLALDGSSPCLLTGYGAYGICLDPGFEPTVLSLVDRGFVWAVAHVRGGGELGESWHDQGRMLRKKTTFTDFIRCAERLIEAGYTSSERLAIQGRSAGGLLIGAVINMRPDLFRAVVAGVPFVDVLSTMLDPDVPLTVIEYEEWGDPRDPEYYDYIRSYSPVDNVTRGEYPHMLVTAGLHDPRVQYWEPARWVARLRARRTDDRMLLLKTSLGAGHTGPSDRYAWLRERAFQLAFVAYATAPDRLDDGLDGDPVPAGDRVGGD